MIPFCQTPNSQAKECNTHRLHAKCGMFSSSHPVALKMNCQYFMCLVAHTNTIRTVANYPDGSPCGEGNYCVKGECRVIRKNFIYPKHAELSAPSLWRHYHRSVDHRLSCQIRYLSIHTGTSQQETKTFQIGGNECSSP